MGQRGNTELEKVERSTGVVAAFQSVTDGVLDLLKTHLELAKAEARQELRAYGSEGSRVGVGLALAGTGFVFVNLALMLVVGVFAGLIGMAIVAAVLGTGYLIVGAAVSRAALRRMKEREGALTSTRNEIKRSTEWVKEIRETS